MILSASPSHIVNDLLQGELAATETYQQALAQVGSDPVADELRRAHADHHEAANRLRQFVHDLGAEPSQSSQTWGAFSKAVEGAAKLLGNNTALQALKAGESHGVSNYQEAIANEHLPEDVVEYLRTTLLPQTQAHVEMLARRLKSNA